MTPTEQKIATLGHASPAAEEIYSSVPTLYEETDIADVVDRYGRRREDPQLEAVDTKCCKGMGRRLADGFRLMRGREI